MRGYLEVRSEEARVALQVHVAVSDMLNVLSDSARK